MDPVLNTSLTGRSVYGSKSDRLWDMFALEEHDDFFTLDGHVQQV